MKLLSGGFSMFRPEKDTLAIVITFAVTFLIAFAVLLVERKSDSPSPETNGTALVATRHETPESSTPLIRSRQPSPPQPVMAIATTAAAAPAAPAISANTIGDSSGAELPIDVNFRRRRGSERYLEGSIFNKSSEDLSIAVYFFSPRTRETSKIELTVPAYHASSFGRDDGLEIEGGDEVTIKSPAFAERRIQTR
jgi:hypothetical protein